jgi:hypothetical protein
VDDGAGEIQKHDPRNECEKGGACAGNTIQASSCGSAGETRPGIPAMANGAFRERLLLALAPKLQESAGAKNQRGLLDEEAA